VIRKGAGKISMPVVEALRSNSSSSSSRSVSNLLADEHIVWVGQLAGTCYMLTMTIIYIYFILQ